MDLQQVTLDGYDWTWVIISTSVTLIIAIGLMVLFIALHQSTDAHKRGDGSGYSLLAGLVIVLGVAAAMITGFAGILASQDWDRQQRLDALVEAGVVQPMLVDHGDSRNVTEAWVGSYEGQFATGSFVPVSGDEWKLVGVLDD